MTANSFLFEEYVFVCLIQHELDDSLIIPYYISKEYNVAAAHQPYMPGHFVFGVLSPEIINPYTFNSMILAEEPAKAYIDFGFNIELHYLQIRKLVEPGMFEWSAGRDKLWLV